jgi:hypothetical protein
VIWGLSPGVQHLAVIKTFSEGELLARPPFMNIASGGLVDSVEKELPSVGFRAVNEGYKQSYGVVDLQSEAVHLFGGDVDVDRSMRLNLEAALIFPGALSGPLPPSLQEDVPEREPA